MAELASLAVMPPISGCLVRVGIQKLVQELEDLTGPQRDGQLKAVCARQGLCLQNLSSKEILIDLIKTVELVLLRKSVEPKHAESCLFLAFTYSLFAIDGEIRREVFASDHSTTLRELVVECFFEVQEGAESAETSLPKYPVVAETCINIDLWRKLFEIIVTNSKDIFPDTDFQIGDPSMQVISGMGSMILDSCSSSASGDQSATSPRTFQSKLLQRLSDIAAMQPSPEDILRQRKQEPRSEDWKLLVAAPDASRLSDGVALLGTRVKMVDHERNQKVQSPTVFSPPTTWTHGTLVRYGPDGWHLVQLDSGVSEWVLLPDPTVEFVEDPNVQSPLIVHEIPRKLAFRRPSAPTMSTVSFEEVQHMRTVRRSSSEGSIVLSSKQLPDSPRSSHQPPSSPITRSPSITKRRSSITSETSPQLGMKRRPFHRNEVLDLCNGIVKHGLGKWKDIMMDGTFSFRSRTAIDLKDKWRNLVKTATGQRAGRRGDCDREVIDRVQQILRAASN